MIPILAAFVLLVVVALLVLRPLLAPRKPVDGRRGDGPVSRPRDPVETDDTSLTADALERLIALRRERMRDGEREGPR